MERKLTKLLNKENRSKSEQDVLDKQVHLIDTLRDIYNTHNKMTMWDYFCAIQESCEKLTEKDKEIDGVIITLRFKEIPKNYGYIKL